MDINKTIATNVKKLREKKKLTLDGAAAATGVSRSMLAQIEKGDVNPTISVLWKIANGYKVSFTALIEEAKERAALICAEDVRPIPEDEGRYLNYPVFGFDERHLFETYRITIAPGGGLQASAHLGGTEEYITVFEGELEIRVGEDVFLLQKGDALTFHSDVPHAYQNNGLIETALSMLIYYSK